MAATGAICPGEPMAEKTTLQIFTKGCFHVERNMSGKVLPLIKIGQIGFQVLSRDLMEQGSGWSVFEI